MTSRNGFRYPRPGEDIGHGPGVVVAPDWDSTPERGHGLHGWLGGAGDPSIASCVDARARDTVWLIIEVPEKDVVELDGKVKFPRGVVLHAGCRDFIHSTLVESKQCANNANFVTLTGGYRSTLTGGDGSTLTGGYRSTLTGGDGSTLTGGDCSTLTGGDGSTLTGGDDSTLTGGYRSTLTGGDCSTLTGGDDSTLTGGDCSTLTGGDCSTLTGGDASTLTGGS